MPTPTQEQTESVSPNDSAGAIQSADEMHDGDRVVYPKQGVCRVLGRQAKEIAGMKLEFIALAREEDNASILVPVAKVPTIGLRKVADSTELADVFDLLASSFDDPELDWKVRHRMHGELLSAGGILGVAEVLKALQGLSNLRPLPQKERERYDAARHLLVNEIAVALGVPPATAEDYIDFALIPPPGVVRPASKPRRLAPLPPPKPARTARKAPVADEDEEFAEVPIDDELELDEDLPADEEEAEGAEEEGEVEEEAEEAPAKKPRKTAAKTAAAKPKAAAAKKPAAKKASTSSAAKRTRKPDDEAEPKKAAPKKAAAEKKTAAAKKPAAKKSAAAKKPAAEKAPARKSTRTKKSE